ncbi:hypothetical protein K438DRAFT_1945548 [Mycena galopus ATCC 62051]|nr:hypothetical protein K438DRAFT_1945548 [Mycena galopus ATCC 62051]
MKFFSTIAAFAAIGLSVGQLYPGVYQITNGGNALTGSSPITVTTNSYTLNQYWQLVPFAGTGSGNWTLLNIGTGLYADVAPVTTNAPVVLSSNALHVFTDLTVASPFTYQIFVTGSSVGSLSFGTTASGEVTLQTANFNSASPAQEWTFGVAGY